MLAGMVERLRLVLDERGWSRPPGGLLVAYSGGPDSTCLLHMVCSLDEPVVAAHLHHGQRPEADDEAGRCRAFALELGCGFVMGRADVPAVADALKVGIEEAGRRARYAFFERAAAESGNGLIATAHTLDDHVETVLFNLARGTGLAGLAGIPAQRANIVRPMLEFRRSETRAYCDANGLWYHDDPANTDVELARGRVRHRILPEFESINPAFVTAVRRLAEIAGDEDRLLDALAAHTLEGCAAHPNGSLEFLTADCEAVFQRRPLQERPPGLVRRAIRLAVEALGAHLDFEQSALVARGLAELGRGSVTAVGGKVAVEWDEDRVTVREVSPASPMAIDLARPGETVSEVFGWAISVTETDAADYARDRGSLDIVIDGEAVQGRLHARPLEPGDSMRPLGMRGTRKITEALSEAGFTVAARRRVPIIGDDSGPIWVPGVVLADRVKVSPETRHALRLRFGAAGRDRGG